MAKITLKKQQEILSILTKYNVPAECYDAVSFAMGTEITADSKKVYLENVLLTSVEYIKLLDLYQTEYRLNHAIETLSVYLGQSGRKYKSHYHTMVNGGWVFKRVQEEMPVQATMTQPVQQNNNRPNTWI